MNNLCKVRLARVLRVNMCVDKRKVELRLTEKLVAQNRQKISYSQQGMSQIGDIQKKDSASSKLGRGAGCSS